MRRAVGLLLVTALAGCGSLIPTGAPTTSIFVAPLGPGEVPLPTPDWVLETPIVCGGVGLDARLAGNPRDPALTWLVDNTLGGRTDVVWPTGYRARFTPALEVLDASGAVVLRAGDLVRGSCSETPDGRFFLAPPFG